jgi:hypothetical protein
MDSMLCYQRNVSQSIGFYPTSKAVNLQMMQIILIWLSHCLTDVHDCRNRSGYCITSIYQISLVLFVLCEWNFQFVTYVMMNRTKCAFWKETCK